MARLDTSHLHHQHTFSKSGKSWTITLERAKALLRVENIVETHVWEVEKDLKRGQMD